MNRYSSMIDKHRKQVNQLDKAAAKHLVRLGVEKDWRDVYRRMQNRRMKHERSTSLVS